MLLHQALRCQGKKEVVAFVGAGGKTTAMFRLAGELAAVGRRVVTTTTTHIFASQMAAAPHYLIARDGDEDVLLAQLPGLLRLHGHVLVVGGVDEARNKVSGITPALVDRMALLDDVDALIVEADGARMRHFKAPAAHEPAIPSCSTLVVPVVSIEAIGRKLDEATVHRPERVAALTGAAMGDLITPQMVAAVLAHGQGGGQHVPAAARLVPLLNKVENDAQLTAAQRVASLLRPQAAVDGVVLAALAADDPVREVWDHTAAIVLAAGGGTRFGSNKMLLPWGGTTLVGQVVDRALAVEGIGEVVVVVGSDGESVAAALQERPVRVVVNESWAQGQSSSLQAGLAALPDNVGAALFLLGDQPEVQTAVMETLLQRHQRTLAAAVLPRYRGQRGNPALFDRSLFAELARLEGDVGGRALIDGLGAEAQWLDFDVAAPFDIDTMQDYERYRRRTGG